MAALGHCWDNLPWHCLVLDHSCIFAFEPTFTVVQASFLVCFITCFIYYLFVGRVPRPGGSSQSSRSLGVPMSVKKTCAKRTLSDEAVWEWTDAKIIGMYTEPTCSPSCSNFTVKPKARNPGSLPCTATTMSHLNGVVRHGRSPSDSHAVSTQPDINH